MINGSEFCPPEPPFWYNPILRFIGMISISFSLFGMWLTLGKTNRKYPYRYFQFYMQITAFFTELHISLVMPAYFYFPIIGGINCGIWKSYQIKYQISSNFLISIFCCLFSFQVPAILSCFFYRFFATAHISPGVVTLPIKYVIYSILVLYHVFPFLMGFSLFKSGLSFEQKYQVISRNYPDCLHVLEDSTFEIYDFETNSNFILYGIISSMFITGAFLVAYLVAWRIFKLLNQYKSFMSYNTFMLHRSSLICLTTQVVGPSLFLGVPLVIGYITVVGHAKHLHSLASTATFFISMYSSVETICMILTTPSFRKWLLPQFLLVKYNMDRRRSTSMSPKSIATFF